MRGGDIDAGGSNSWRTSGCSDPMMRVFLCSKFPCSLSRVKWGKDAARAEAKYI